MTRKTLTAAALSLALAPLAASAADRLVILSDAMPKETARTVLAQSKVILGAVQPGDTVTFLNGTTGTEIAHLALPAGAAGQEVLSSRRKIAREFSPVLKAVTDFSVEAVKTEASLSDDQLPLQVNLPGVLHNLTIHADKNPDVLVFGTLRHQDPRNPAYDMTHSFPNDAHVFHDPSVTPFGAAGRDGQLDGTRIHFCDMDQGYVKDIQRLGLERAAGLLVQGYGATLANATQDVDQCVRSGLAGKVDTTKRFTADGNDQKLRIYDALQTGQAPTTNSQQQAHLFDRLPLPAGDKLALANLMQQNRVTLAEVYLFDTASTDGDVVALISGPVRFEVALTKTRQQVIVPITDGALRLQGVRDGHGGITVGVETEAGDKIVSPVMRVGEVIDLPFLPVS